jgi:hypothetical protein
MLKKGDILAPNELGLRLNDGRRGALVQVTSLEPRQNTFRAVILEKGDMNHWPIGTEFGFHYRYWTLCPGYAEKTFEDCL